MRPINEPHKIIPATRGRNPSTREPANPALPRRRAQPASSGSGQPSVEIALEYWIREADLDVDATLDPIVLTPEQCQRYQLPRTPLKETESRAAKFEDRFGSGATELDALEALHPGELRKIVDDEVLRYIDPTLPGRTPQAKPLLSSPT